MTEPDLDALAARVADAIGDSLTAGELGIGRMVGDFVLVGNVFTEDGDRRTLVTANGDLLSALGLLKWGMVIQEAFVAQRATEEDAE